MPDAQFFFSELPGENYLRYVPNTDHSLDTDAITGGIEFMAALLAGAALPQFTWTVSNDGTEITLNTATPPTSVTMWQATNPDNRDFRLETFGPNWTSSPLNDQGGGTYVANVTPPTMGATDFFIQMQYAVDGMTLTFTTQISTVPLLTPTVTVSDMGGMFNGSAYAASATSIGLAGLAVPGNFTYTYYAGTSGSGPGSATAPTNVGTYTVVASFTSTDPDYVNGTATGDVYHQSRAAHCDDRAGHIDHLHQRHTGRDRQPGGECHDVQLCIRHQPDAQLRHDDYDRATGGKRDDCRIRDGRALRSGAGY